MTSFLFYYVISVLVVFYNDVAALPRGTTYDSPEVQFRDPCQNLYGRYCDLMVPSQCYNKNNEKLCCDQCANFNNRFGYMDDEEVCLFGDRNETCGMIDTKYCYDPDHRHYCCGTCGEVRTSIPGCRYGDKDQAICSRVRSYDCYNPEIEETCCSTCNRFYRNKNGCEYGDHRRFYKMGRRRYSCAAYVGYFGFSRCRFSWGDDDFQETCCDTCQRKSKRKFSRISRFARFTDEYF